MVETIILLGREISLYYSCWLLGVLCIFILGWNLKDDFGFNFSKTTLILVFDLILGYLLIWVMSWISGGGQYNGYNYVRIVPVMPILFVPIAYAFKEPFWKISDFLAASSSIMQGVSHFGCIFSGCCNGYPSEWGIYSNYAETVCFPIQPIEGIINIVITAVLFWMAKAKKQQGKLYIWYMISFGATRFICEFYRDNAKVWHNVSELALYALASLLLGIIALAFIKRKGKGS